MESINSQPGHHFRFFKGFWISNDLVSISHFETILYGTQTTDSDAPIRSFSWDDAERFCSKLFEKELQSGHIEADHIYSLPTEAQWKYALAKEPSLFSDKYCEWCKDVWFPDFSHASSDGLTPQIGAGFDREPFRVLRVNGKSGEGPLRWKGARTYESENVSFRVVLNWSPQGPPYEEACLIA